MSEAAPASAVASVAGHPGELGARVDALRARGADRADPVRFRFIEVLARRTTACDGELRRILEAKLSKALAECVEQLDRVDCSAGSLPERQSGAAMAAAGGLRRSVAMDAPYHGHRGPLAELVDHIARHSPDKGMTGSPGAGAQAAGAGVEEATLRYFRRVWSTLSVDHQLSQSLATVPQNAGPLNSHRLVSRSLGCLRGLSPAYLQRFVSHVDALLWLDHASGSVAPAPAVAPRGVVEKKRKPSRRKGA